MNLEKALVIGALLTAVGLTAFTWFASHGGNDIHGCRARGGVVVRGANQFTLHCVKPLE